MREFLFQYLIIGIALIIFRFYNITQQIHMISANIHLVTLFCIEHPNNGCNLFDISVYNLRRNKKLYARDMTFMIGNRYNSLGLKFIRRREPFSKFHIRHMKKRVKRKSK